MKNKKFITITLTGCGRVAEHYKFVFKNLNKRKFKIVGVSDLLSDRAISFSKHFSCPYYTDLKNMLKIEKPDLNIILTPSSSHYPLSKISLNLNCNTITEKPISMNFVEAEKLKKIAKKKRLMYGCVFQNRFNPAIKFLKEKYDHGSFGKIITTAVRLRWCRTQDYYNDEWHGTWFHDGGVINQQAIHHLDVLNWINGPITEVSSFSTNILNKLEAEDTAVSIFKFKNNSIGTFEATTSARPYDHEASLTILFEKGIFEIGGIALNKIIRFQIFNSRSNFTSLKKKFSENVKTGYGRGHIPFYENVIKNLLNNSIKSPINVNDSIYTTRLVHSMYYSIENKISCKLSDYKISRYLGKKIYKNG